VVATAQKVNIPTRLPEERQLAVVVLVGLASALQGDLVVRELSAFLHRRGLGVRIKLWFRRWLCDLAGIDRMSAADWSNHFLVL